MSQGRWCWVAMGQSLKAALGAEGGQKLGESLVWLESPRYSTDPRGGCTGCSLRLGIPSGHSQVSSSFSFKLGTTTNYWAVLLGAADLWWSEGPKGRMGPVLLGASSALAGWSFTPALGRPTGTGGRLKFSRAVLATNTQPLRSELRGGPRLNPKCCMGGVYRLQPGRVDVSAGYPPGRDGF